jgi:hypothetical protein
MTRLNQALGIITPKDVNVQQGQRDMVQAPQPFVELETVQNYNENISRLRFVQDY